MLEKINQIFGDIKDAIVQQGVEVGDCDSPDTYADRILQIDVCNNAEDCEEGGEGGGGSSSSKGYVYFFFPAFRASEKQPDTPSGSIRSLFTVTSGNYVQTLNYPSGWASATVAIANEVAKYDMTANPTLNPMWMSYCIVAIRNDSPSYYMDWTTPLCLGYPYANPTSDEWVGNGGNGGNGGSDNNYYNGSRTFLIYAELGSTGYTLSTPVGGTWDTETNQLVGDVTSNSSNGQVRWSVNNNHTPGMYTYISIGTFGYDGNIIGTWSDPFCINASNGKDGRNGVDGVNIEFIYKLCANLDAFSELTTPESNRNVNGSIPTGWTATPSGVDGTYYRVEACSTRKLETSTRWSAWSKPVIWAMWSDGSDGSGSGGGSGSDSGGGSGSGGMLNVEYWYKLSNQETGITTPDLRFENPDTSVAGSWSKTPGNVTSTLPFLWCFVQINYDHIISNGFKYERLPAFIVRRLNVDTSAEFENLGLVLEEVKQRITNKIGNFQNDLINANNSLNDFKALLESKILLDHLNSTTQRVQTIENTGTTEITGDGLWEMLTSYDGTGEDGSKKKSFSDIVLDAEDAKATLQTGAAYFDALKGAGIIVDADDPNDPPHVELFATQTDVQGYVNDAVFNADATTITTSVSTAQKCWEGPDPDYYDATKKNILYKYTWHMEDAPSAAGHYDMTGHNLSEYEAYMSKSHSQGGPIDGPFTLVPVIDTFSNIKQTAESIESSVQNSIKYLQCVTDESDIKAYDFFNSEFEQYQEDWPSYSRDYEYYVRNTRNGNKYTVITTGDALSDIIQKADNINLKVGKVNKYWRKPNNNNLYDYTAYAWDGTQSVSTYESSMRSAGWELADWNDKLSVIDMTDENITLAVNNAKQYWVRNSTITNTNKPKKDWVYETDYVEYDKYVNLWKSSTHTSVFDATQYNTYMVNQGWQLITLNVSTAAIDINSDNITQSVSDLEDQMSLIRTTAGQIALASSKKVNVWVDDGGEYYDYDYFRNAWLATNPNPQTDAAYETWVHTQGIYTKRSKTDIGGQVVQHDHIMLGLGDDQGNYVSAIRLDRTDGGTGKIELDASEVKVNGTLSADIVNSAFANVNNLTVTSRATINSIVASSVTANTLESIDEDFTKRILIEDGKAEFYLWDDTMNNTDGGWRKRIEIGVEGSNNNDLVLKFFDENGTELYNLGPAGLTDVLGGIVKDSDGIIIDSDGNWF